MYRESRRILDFSYQSLERMGVDIENVLNVAGLKPKYCFGSQPKERFNHKSHLAFWPALEREANDPYIGLHLAEHVSPHASPIQANLLMSSPTLQIGLEQYAYYMCLMTDAVDIKLETFGPKSALMFEFKDVETSNLRHYVDAYFAHAIKSIVDLTGGVFKPSKVYLPYEDLCVAEYERFFNCEVIIGSSQCECIFDSELLRKSALGAEPELFSIHEKFAAKQLDKIEARNSLSEIEDAIVNCLVSGDTSIGNIADSMAISIEALRQRLSKNKTSIRKLVSKRREELSKFLLKETKESIEQIIYLTGFAEAASFYRAFRRWTGTTPVEYRKQEQSKNKANGRKPQLRLVS